MDCFVASLLAMTARLEHRDVFQQREHAEDDDDDPADLLGAAVDRQHVDQIEDEDDDKECDKRADDKRHLSAPFVSPGLNALPALRFQGRNPDATANRRTEPDGLRAFRATLAPPQGPA